MAGFYVPPIGRDQGVLFPVKLDDHVPTDHPVRLLDEILNQLSWSTWESNYHLGAGQPPIHPKVIVAVILYGLLKKIRSTRELEEAIQVRSDFRWLAQGITIDHTTICKFRNKNSERIQQVYIDLALIAGQLGYLTLKTLGFDGTRIRSYNRRSGRCKVSEITAIKEELQKKFQEIQQQLKLADSEDDRVYGKKGTVRLKSDLRKIELRTSKIAAAIQVIEQLKKDNHPIPDWIPLNDPESRIMKSKDGGFSPGYTPIATVDVDSGMIVDAGVISTPTEEKEMLSAVENVVENFKLDKPPEALLADGLMSTGENLKQCQEKGIELYSPLKLDYSKKNPAVRSDLQKPVADADIEKLPVEKRKGSDGKRYPQFKKSAFIYDKERNSYWCPAGKELRSAGQTTKRSKSGKTEVSDRYLADPTQCGACALKSLCIRGNSKKRSVTHGPHETLRIAQANKMAQESAKEKYAKRSHACESPFARIKERFSVRQFFTLGLRKVRAEWYWCVAAFNLQKLLAMISGNAGPPMPKLKAS